MEVPSLICRSGIKPFAFKNATCFNVPSALSSTTEVLITRGKAGCIQGDSLPPFPPAQQILHSCTQRNQKGENPETTKAVSSMQNYPAIPDKHHMVSNFKLQEKMLGNLQELLWVLLKYSLSKQDNNEESKKTSKSDILPKRK